MQLTQTIILVGMMGAGKTSIGKRLARYLRVPFTDIDEEVEKHIGKSVSWIFTNVGEEAFRHEEHKALEQALKAPPHIMATGGGALTYAPTQQAVDQARAAHQAMTLWLEADKEVLLARVSGNPTRPLLAQGDPEETLEALLAVRTPIYAKSDLHVFSHEGPHARIVDSIVALLKEKEVLHA